MREKSMVIRVSGKERALIQAAASLKKQQPGTWIRGEIVRRAEEALAPVDVLAEQRARQLEIPVAKGRGLFSLFCGPGGLDEGFRQAGFGTTLAIDNDAECVKTFAHNHSEAKVFQADISQLTIPKLDSLLGKKVEPIGVLGGPPCQSFSVSNVHQRDDDPRHKLPEAYAGLLKGLNQRSPISFFVFENVPGLLGSKHIHRYEMFKGLFEKAGFKIFEATLNARDYEVPQDRERVFIVGINAKKHPGVAWTPPAKVGRTLTVRDTIANFPEPAFSERGLDSAKIPLHPNHWTFKVKSKKFSGGKLYEGQMYGRSFRTLFWDQPSWTVAYGHREVHVHPKGHRRLSMYEAMLLQTFPHHYQLLGSISAQSRLVSEAVPPRLAFHIARSIKDALKL